MKINQILTLAAFMAILISCGPGGKIDSSISMYEKESAKIKLGDSKEKVIALLEPTQQYDKEYRKKSEKFLNNNNETIEILYYRSDRVGDGLITDDEFTPYIFKDSKLIGIGWSLLGGAKTRGEIESKKSNNQEGITININRKP